MWFSSPPLGALQTQYALNLASHSDRTALIGLLLMIVRRLSGSQSRDTFA